MKMLNKYATRKITDTKKTTVVERFILNKLNT